MSGWGLGLFRISFLLGAPSYKLCMIDGDVFSACLWLIVVSSAKVQRNQKWNISLLSKNMKGHPQQLFCGLKLISDAFLFFFLNS